MQLSVNVCLLRIVIIFLLLPQYLFSNNNTYSSVINVRIYSSYSINELNFRVINGTYNIKGDNNLLTTISASVNCQISVENRKLKISIDGQTFNNISNIRFESLNQESVFNIRSAIKAPSRNYDDNLSVSIEGNSIRLVNNVDIEKYVAAVVQAEGGIMNNSEFFKVQAVACRTYVLRNIRRHHKEGYHMCDRVHCQVYHGKCNRNDIIRATEQTKNFVVVDKNLNFINAAFHSNCGGETVNSENVWSLPSTYIKSVKDTFCLNSKHSIWEFRIKQSDFLNYLNRTFNFPIHDSLLVQKVISFSQENGRMVFFLNMPNIHLKVIRADLKLKSTFFSIYEEGEDLIFRGRGFGHGAGLCQEGAMQMINAGHRYDDIIKFYYTDVYIISYEDVLETN